MQNYEPLFKDENEKSIMKIAILLGIFFGFIPYLLLMILCKDMLSENSMEIAKAFFNLDICLFILNFGLGLVPIVNFAVPLVCFCLWIWLLIISVKAFKAIDGNGMVEIPVIVKIF